MMFNSWEHNFINIATAFCATLKSLCNLSIYLWNSSCTLQLKRLTKSLNVTLSGKPCTQIILLTVQYKLSRNDSMQWNQKYYSNIHFQTTWHKDLLWYITYDDARMCSLCILNNLPMVWKHPNIVLLMSHFFPRLALVRGQPQTACGGIGRYCQCHIDALQGPGGHVSVNIHYQNP